MFSPRLPALFGVFLVSGLSTWAGIAGASAAPEGSVVVEPSVVAPASVAALLDEAPNKAEPPTPSVDWAARIDARLEALAAEPRATPGEARDRRLEARVHAALAELGPGTRVAVEIRDLEHDAQLVSVGGDRSLNPASNQKLITAIAAVELLGADYRFETTVSRASTSLIVRGEGDPDLHLADLHKLAATVVASGQLDGVTQIVIDDRAFDARTLGPGFRSDGPGESYVAPSGALAIEFGTVEITVRPGRFLAAPEVSVEPFGAALELHNGAKTQAGTLAVTTRAGEQGRTIVEIDGSISAGHSPITIRRRVNDPGLLAATAFAELLAAQTGSPPLPVVRGPIPSGTPQVLATHESAPLHAVLASALRYSNNFTAEQVLRTLAWRASGRAGNWADGVATLERFASAISPELAAAQTFVNGSGLNREGRLSPQFVNDVVALVDRPGSSAQTLLSSFARAGGEGTMHYRIPSAGVRLLAKTGTYAGASTLSGLVTAADERRIGFSILINGGDLDRNRAVQDRIVAALLY